MQDTYLIKVNNYINYLIQVILTFLSIVVYDRYYSSEDSDFDDSSSISSSIASSE
jgi:hypothetical protein